MPPVSLRRMHPDEAAELAALLTQLWKSSGRTQRDLAEELHISAAAMSRYLSGQEVIPQNTLTGFLDAIGADPDDRKRANKLSKTINTPLQGQLTGETRKRRSKTRTLSIAGASVAGLAGLVALGLEVLSDPDPAPAPPATTCSDRPPPHPTAWSASCGAKVTFDRANSQFTLTDLAADGSGVILKYQLDHGDWLHAINKKGAKNPPKPVEVNDVDAETVVKFYVCVEDADAKNEARRGVRDCGQSVTDPAR